MSAMQSKIVFAKSPLIEVIFEIRFTPNMSAACRRDEFYNEIRESYPEVFLPKISFEQHPFAQPTQYLNTDKSKRITCSADSLSISTTKYKDFHTFRQECLGLIDIFHRKYATINKVKRIGLRYINKITTEKQIDKKSLREYLNFDFSLPDSLSKHTLSFFQTSFFIELESKTSGIRVAVNNGRDKDGKNFITLDFDLISLVEVNFKDIAEHFDKYHSKIEEIFLNITTDAYKKFIG